jgi:predicted nucleic acid-binding protein
MPTSGAEVLPSRIALDTSAYSWLRRAEPRTIAAVSEADMVYIAATVLGELEAGFRAGSRYLDNQRALEDFVDEPYCEIIDIDPDVARRYGEVFAALKRAGTPIPVNDIWIAAATLDSGAHLITFDGDFSKVEGLPHTLFVSS